MAEWAVALFFEGRSGQRKVSGADKRRTYVEDDDSVLSPLDPGLTVLGIGEMLEEELEQSVAFFLLEADDLLGV